MFSLLLGLVRLGQSIARAFRDAAFRGLLLLYVALVALGTVFYVRAEGWSVLDAVYFCVMTLATVGYGDVAPRTPLGKLFTIVYVLIGTGVFVVLAAELAVGVIRLRNEREGDQAARRAVTASRAESPRSDERSSTTKESS